MVFLGDDGGRRPENSQQRFGECLERGQGLWIQQWIKGYAGEQGELSRELGGYPVQLSELEVSLEMYRGDQRCSVEHVSSIGEVKKWGQDIVSYRIKFQFIVYVLMALGLSTLA